MTSSQLIDYITSAGFALSLIFWINVFIAYLCGFLDKRD